MQAAGVSIMAVDIIRLHGVRSQETVNIVLLSCVYVLLYEARDVAP
jgi:hypothetical protein